MRVGKLFKISLVILFAAGVCTVGFSKDAQVSSVWTTAPPKIDGVGDDWDAAGMNLEKKLEVNYAFRNDQKFMYILFSFNNPKFMSSVSATGLTMYINTDGKKKKDYSINFVLKNVTNVEFIALLEQRQGPLEEDRKTQIMANPSYSIFDYTVDTKDKGAVPPGTKIVPAVYRIQSDKQKKTAAYEIAIPLDRVVPVAPGIGAEAGSKVKIGFAWGGWTKELKEAAANRVGTQGSQARSGQAGTVGTASERVNEGPRSSLTAMRRGAPKKYDFWVDVSLANNQ